MIDPMAIEKAYREAQSDEFDIYTKGITSASVCSSLGKEATIERMASLPSGTSTGWTLADASQWDDWDGAPNPCPCDMMPETHMHYLFEC